MHSIIISNNVYNFMFALQDGAVLNAIGANAT